MAGTLTATTIQNDTSSPPTFRNNSVEIGTLCRAWVNFNGTGTVAIRGSFNVSSITDNGTGDYTVNFTTAMPDANYSAVVSADNVDCGSGIATVASTGVSVPPTTTAVRIWQFLSDTNAPTDAVYFCVSIFR
jgi:hypothetical protein